jgi:hypothetical protein
VADAGAGYWGLVGIEAVVLPAVAGQRGHISARLKGGPARLLCMWWVGRA